MPATGSHADQHYDVCLSFASEQRDYVAEVAHLLQAGGVEVFYDRYATAELMGKDLIDHMAEIYGKRSGCCLLFVSADYRRRMWTGLERSAAVDRALRAAGDYILPVRFDDTSIPGVRDSLGFVDARQRSPAELVALTMKKLGWGSGDLPGVDVSLLTIVADRAPIDTETVLRFALAGTGVTLPAHCQSHVDGRSVVMVPRSVANETDVLTTLIPAVESVLDERVRSTVGGPTPALRIAMHRGVVPAVGDWDCYDAALTVDMALAPPSAHLLEDAERADSVVIVSHRVYEELVKPARRGVDPAAYQQIVLPRGNVAWARVTGYSKPPEPRRRQGGHTRPGVATKRTTIIRDSVVGQVGDIYYGGTHD